MLRQFAFACVIGLVCPAMSMAEPRAGIDLSAIDSAVPPQQDFWQFANGKWLAATSIPPDRSAWDTFSQLRETTQMQLRNVIESVDPADPAHPERRKLADLYAAFMDEAGVEKAGLAGLHDTLQRIHGLRDKADLPALFAELSQLWVRIPWDIDVYPDEHDATVYAAHLGQGRLGLPDRDYYLKDEPRFQSIRSAYRDHIVKLLSLAGEPAAESSADAIIALETALARLQWTRVQNRDPIKTYNKTAIAELPALIAPQDLPSFINAAGVGSGIAAVVVKQPSYFAGIGAILRDTPVESWQAYLVYNVLSSYAPYLAAPFRGRGFRVRAARIARRAGDAAALETGGCVRRSPDRLRPRQALCQQLFSRGQQGTRRDDGRQYPGSLSRGHRDLGLDGA